MVREILSANKVSKKKSILFIIFSMTYLFSCKHEERKLPVNQAGTYKSPLDNYALVNRLKDSVMKYGSDRAYGVLSSYYELESLNPELLYYGLVMANKYNNAEGYYHVYIGLSTPYTGETLAQLDKRTEALALHYLLKSYELGYESAKYQVIKIFGENKPVPKSSYYLQEFVKREEMP